MNDAIKLLMTIFACLLIGSAINSILMYFAILPKSQVQHVGTRLGTPGFAQMNPNHRESEYGDFTFDDSGRNYNVGHSVKDGGPESQIDFPSVN